MFGLYYAEGGQWDRLQLLVGLLCSVKPFLGLLGVFLLIRRQWRAAALAVAAASGAFALGVVIFGLEAHREWLGAIKDAHWIGSVMNASVYGLIGRTWSLDVSTTTPVARFVATCFALGIVITAIAAVWRTADLDRAMLILLATSLLASPLGWVYDTPILLGPMIALRHSRSLGPQTYPALVGFMIPHALALAVFLTIVCRDDWLGIYVEFDLSVGASAGAGCRCSASP